MSKNSQADSQDKQLRSAATMSAEVLSLILGGGRGTRLYPLTMLRSKPAVPIGGKYRLIDIPISNCINSGFNRIYVLTQFLSVSLHRHIANTYKFDPFSRGFVQILAAQQTNERTDWYQGTADAVRQQLRYVEEDPCQHVLILSGDQLYRMDFRQLYRTHEQSGADVTISVLPVTAAAASGLGIVRVDDTGRVVGFVEKPQRPEQLEPLRMPEEWFARQGLSCSGRHYLASMGIYLFRRQTLIELLHRLPQATDFGKEIFPQSIATHHVQAHLFDGYWEDVGTIKAYHQANLALCQDDPPFDFYSPDGVIYTRMRYLPASRVIGAQLDHCLISDGCVIQAGARLTRCVVGLRTRLGPEVEIRDTVIIGADRFETDAERAANRRQGVPDLGVGAGSVIVNAILDKDCRIGTGVRLINRRQVQHEQGPNYVIRDGILVIPKGAMVPDGTVI
jgi:glucose-1-phosphate adenylyltransferase